MFIISLGGVGGCSLAEVLRKLNQPAYPYDWIISTQSFILKSFNNIDNFLKFQEEFVYDTTKLLDKNKKAIILHDFNNFILEKDKVKEKYERRFKRLNESLNNKEDILFVRLCDNLKEELIPKDYYNNILIREEEDIYIWTKFIKMLRKFYKKNITLLIINKNNNPEELYNIIKDVSDNKDFSKELIIR